LDATFDDTPIGGNLMASGDDEADRAAEAEVRERLEHTEWAWAVVRVQAEYLGHTGEDCLGACSYEDEKDFRENSGYFEDMVTEALVRLAQSILADFEALVELAGELTSREPEDEPSAFRPCSTCGAPVEVGPGSEAHRAVFWECYGCDHARRVHGDPRAGLASEYEDRDDGTPLSPPSKA
jgi:hypothetical protein